MRHGLTERTVDSLTQKGGHHVQDDEIALWHWVEHGVLPEGAVLKTNLRLAWAGLSRKESRNPRW
jgi:hypothetical protein